MYILKLCFTATIVCTVATLARVFGVVPGERVHLAPNCLLRHVRSEAEAFITRQQQVRVNKCLRRVGLAMGIFFNVWACVLCI